MYDCNELVQVAKPIQAGWSESVNSAALLLLCRQNPLHKQ
jgi:hypothetical protein